VTERRPGRGVTIGVERIQVVIAALLTINTPPGSPGVLSSGGGSGQSL